MELKLEKLRLLRELQARKEQQDRDRLAKVDVLAELGFEPVCKPRVLARMAGTPEDELPEPCGQCPQERFMATPHANIDVLYGGAGGGGKSWSLLAYAIRAAVELPGLQVFWFRRSFPELNQSVLRTLARYGYAKKLGARWDGSKYELRFPGGSSITFGHAKNMMEAASLSSAEINLLILDERTTIPPAVVDFLYTRVRSGVEGVPCLGIRSASNPGHIGHGVVKAGFVDATDYGTKEITDAAGRRRSFIPAKATDNPYVGDYAKTLAGIEDPDLRARIMDGDWSAMPDAAFPDWKRDRIVVPAFTLPESWARYGGMDYGWSAPSVYLAAAKDNDGRLWLYRELTMIQTPEREQARRILAANEGQVMRVIAGDPAMWGKTGSSLPPADQMATEGLGLTKADNDRLGGKSRMHTYLAEGPACAYHREQGWDTCPMLHVLDGTCPKFVKTMGELPRDPNRPEDVDTDAEDHWYDACFVAGTLITTRRGDVPIEHVQAGDEVLTRAGWRQVRDAARTGVNQPVMTMTASDGRTLTGTGNHPVYVTGRGFTRLDALRYQDTLWTCLGESKQLCSTASPSAATPTRNVPPTARTSRQASPTRSAGSTGSTGKSGKPRTALSRLVTTSIIETTIRATTTWTTSSASRTRNTRATTPASPSPTPSAQHDAATSAPPPHGTAAPKAAPGTPNTAARRGKGARHGRWSARTAAPRSPHATAGPTPGSARTSAAPTPAKPAEWTTRTAPVPAAGQRSGSTAIPAPATAPAHVRGLSDAGTADVYNLSVDGEQEYFANGILVHNCRYLVMAIGGGPSFIVFDDDDPDPERLQELGQDFGPFALRGAEPQWDETDLGDDDDPDDMRGKVVILGGDT